VKSGGEGGDNRIPSRRWIEAGRLEVVAAVDKHLEELLRQFRRILGGKSRNRESGFPLGEHERQISDAFLIGTAVSFCHSGCERRHSR
jgi:hypothetical protein